MSLDTVKGHLKKYNKDKDIIILDKSIATVLEAAQVLNTDSDNIAKTLAFGNNKNGCILIVVSGNSAIELSIKELETISGSSKWIDVCKPKDTIN